MDTSGHNEGITTGRILRFCAGKECNTKRDCDGTICRGEMLAPLSQMSKIIIENENLAQTLSVLLALMKTNMGVKRGMVNLFNRRTGKIFIHDSIGLTEKEKARGVYSLGEGITGKVVQTKEIIVVPRICDEPDFLNKTKSHTSPEDSKLAFICVPIVRGHNVLGTLSVERICDNPALLKYDVELLSIVGSLIVQAVEVYLLEHEERNYWKTENQRLQNALKAKFHPKNILGNSKPMLEVYSLIEKITKTKTTVLLLGESGVGKELVANAIHYNGFQAHGPFVMFNCAALPESLIESELFGHEKGAFTGADNTRKGRFEEADGGTIFLDEIGELSLAMQAKLLRVLQEKTFERVGQNKSLKVDIRIIAATNKDLAQMVKDGTFREDLFYRLSVFPIMIPPLRERGSDIILLAEHFALHYARQFDKELKRISASVHNMLLSYSWPGNVRELENVIERAVILSEDCVLHSYNFPLYMQPPVATHEGTQKRLTSKLEIVEYEMIVEALSINNGNISATAKDLGISRRVLGLRIEKFGINSMKFKE